MNPLDNPLNRILSSELLQQGVDLKSLGINEYAWDSDTIKKVFDELARKRIGILGGDVYKISGNRIEVTCDNWYANHDGSDDFYQKSRIIALEYIDKYEKNNCGKYIYSITI